MVLQSQKQENYQFSENKWNSNYGVSVLFVTATVGSGEEAISKTIPVFIRQNKDKNGNFRQIYSICSKDESF